MSESITPSPLERRRPPLGPRAPTTPARRTFWALFAAAVALTVYVVWPFRSPLFLAAVLAAAFQPLLARTERLLKGRRRLAGALLTVLVLGAIVAPIASILAFIAQQITQGLIWVRDSLGVQSVGDISLSQVPPQAQHVIDNILSTLHLSREQVQAFAAKALDYAQQGIRVNTLIPGTTDTPFLRKAAGMENVPDAVWRVGLNQWVKNNVPGLGRLATAEEVAALALTLASDDHPFMTGAQIVLDGGKTAKAG